MKIKNIHEPSSVPGVLVTFLTESSSIRKLNETEMWSRFEIRYLSKCKPLTNVHTFIASHRIA